MPSFGRARTGNDREEICDTNRRKYSGIQTDLVPASEDLLILSALKFEIPEQVFSDIELFLAH
jgi:hypothetical protein